MLNEVARTPDNLEFSPVNCLPPGWCAATGSQNTYRSILYKKLKLFEDWSFYLDLTEGTLRVGKELNSLTPLITHPRVVFEKLPGWPKIWAACWVNDSSGQSLELGLRIKTAISFPQSSVYPRCK